MFSRSSLACLLAFYTVILSAPNVLAEAKRPLKHEDADSWRSIGSPQLSRDGHFVAYALMPQEGDGEYVVRDLRTAKEWRQATGSSSVASLPPRSSRPGQPRGPLTGGGNRLGFSADSKFALLSVSPTKKELEQAKAEKKPAPRSALVILDLGTLQATRIENVRSWTLPEESATHVAYFRLPKPETPNPQPQPMKPTQPGTSPTPQRTYGSELVIRNLVAHTERVIPDVGNLLFSKDGKLLVYTVSSKKEDDNGVYVVSPGNGSPPLTILAGKGRYSSLTWDEKQEQLVFLAEQGTKKPNAPARFKVHHWERKSVALSFAMPPSLTLPGLVSLTTAQVPPPAKAVELVSSATDGFKENWTISERDGLSFSRDGSRVYLSAAPPELPAATNVQAEQRVDLDVWHWKDDFIQPMQRVQAERERSRTFRAVYHLKEKKFVQLSDEKLQSIATASDGATILGSDDRPYRRLMGQATFSGFADVFLVDPIQGTRKPFKQKVEGGLSLSPGGKYLVAFDGKNWRSTEIATGKSVNLTGKLNVAFHDEEHDRPIKPGSYGLAGWTAGDVAVLVHDRFDIWQLALDGSSAKNLTQGAGRKSGVRFNIVSLDPRERTINLDKPLLLHATNLDTLDTGFHQLEPNGGALKELVMGPRYFSHPVKARDADVYLLTAQSFSEAPEILKTDRTFKELKKRTDANAQKKDLLWGKAELISYKSGDGVPLRGMLIKPENLQPGKKYPMVVYIYERLSDGLHRFVAPRPGTSINPSFYASNGYLVLLPDITYTTGMPGQSAMKCVLPAIQAVADKGILNEKAIGIQGHSWGGYQIAYMITQTSRFKAAVAGAPVANMTSAYGGVRWGTGLPRQFQYEYHQSRIGGTLWQYPIKFIENSPIFMADRVQTPLVMLHNDQDDAVPWYQGIEYYLALRRLEKEVYLLNYNNERHGLIKRAHQKDYSVRMQEFFDHHLKGAAKPVWMAKGVSYLERVRKYGAPTSPFAPGPESSGGGENEEEEP